MRRLFYLITWASLAVIIFNACERIVEEEDSSDNDNNNSVYSEDESDYEWDSLNTTLIALNGSDVEITGKGATYSSSQVVIDTGGTYQITGELTNGQIHVLATETDTIKLILDNVDITNKNGPAVYVESAGRAIIILNDNSDNYLEDGSTYSNEELNGTIYSKSDLAFSGEGALKVTGNYKDGIVSKDGLILSSGSYVIDVVDDGIRGKDYLVINDGTYSIISGGDAIKSDNENDGLGYIQINSGDFSITASDDGISAFSDLLIYNGTFDITCTAKALKAGSLIQIEDGDFTLESIDDAIHSNYDISINEGDFSINTDDDGIHTENDLVIENATITINSSVEGIEGGYITVNGGTIIVKATDDGFNATQGTETMGDDGSQLTVNGGTITVTVSGGDVDAMDSNGDITITGGTVNLYHPTQGPCEGLDANGTITVGSGATVYDNGEQYTGSSSSNSGGRF